MYKYSLASKKNFFSGGFTLIEILVVMVIIGILATIGSNSFRSSQLKSRDAKRKADLRHIAESLEAYYNDVGRYPEDGEFNNDLVNGNPFVNPTSISTIYMVNLPKDPGKNDTQYFYMSRDGNSYQLYALLENEEDRDIKRDVVDDEPLFYDDTSCGANSRCNFGISSSNITAETDRILSE
jgi:general secretion pathway protein G